jgi:serine/threonine protein kinase
MPQSGSSNSAQPRIVIRGRPLAYLERRWIRRREYYLLERIGSPRRERYKAFDPLAGPGGDFFQIQSWDSSPRATQHLRRLARLKVEPFPRVVEWERHTNGYSVVLTWVEGPSLSQYFEILRVGHRPPIDPGEATRLIRGLANGVCKLHSQLRICHGDIQPANVILTRHPSRLLLIDFGSAWVCESALARVPGDGAHPCYCAPELWADAAVNGFHADQFSVSVLFYQLLTQNVPYQGLGGKAGWDEFARHSPLTLIPPSEVTQVCRDLPRTLREQLDRTVLRGLALRPEDRFADPTTWLNEMFELHARLRLTPQPSRVERWLIRLMDWFAKPSTTALRE